MLAVEKIENKFRRKGSEMDCVSLDGHEISEISDDLKQELGNS